MPWDHGTPDGPLEPPIDWEDEEAQPCGLCEQYHPASYDCGAIPSSNEPEPGPYESKLFCDLDELLARMLESIKD